MRGRIPTFIVKETQENANYIVIEKDGIKMILLNLIGSAGFTMLATKNLAWYNIIIAILFGVGAIVWVLAMIHIHSRLKKEKKKHEEINCSNASPDWCN
jgi:hypothetical protein